MSRIANEIRVEIADLTRILTACGLAIDSRIAQIHKLGTSYEVNWDKEKNVSISFMLKNVPYSTIFKNLVEGHHYNFRLCDGAIIQFLYKFKNEELIAHRVCYFPAPYDPESMSDTDNTDRLFTELPIIRIDYSPDSSEELIHPTTHLHLGHANNCRIPTSAPIRPNTFILFILRSFYNNVFTVHKSLEKSLNIVEGFSDTLLSTEKEAPHLKIPSNTPEEV